MKTYLRIPVRVIIKLFGVNAQFGLLLSLRRGHLVLLLAFALRGFLLLWLILWRCHREVPGKEKRGDQSC